MPVINIDLGSGQATEQQKKQLISRLATDAAEITGIGIEKFITFINEFPAENIGLGTKTLKEVKAGQ